MLQRLAAIPRIVPIWLLLILAMSITTLAFDVRFLRRDSKPPQVQSSGWRSKRLTEMACHCCSNSFNSHCCFQCMQRVGKRGSTNKVKPDSTIDSAVHSSRDFWTSMSSPKPLKSRNSLDSTREYSAQPKDSSKDLLRKSRACACCLQIMHLDRTANAEWPCCQECKASDENLEYDAEK